MPEKETSPTSSRKLVLTGLLAVLLVGTVTFFFFPIPGPGKRMPRPDCSSNKVQACLGSENLGQNDRELPALESTTTLTSSGAGGVLVPVHWVGDPLDGIEVKVLPQANGTNAVAVARLSGSGIACPELPNGSYRFDLAAVEIYAADHRLIISGQSRSLVTMGGAVDGRLVLSRGMTIQVAVSLAGDAGSSSNVECMWQPLSWPVAPPPQRRRQLAINGQTSEFVPLGGIKLFVNSKEFYLKSPIPAEFRPSESNAIVTLVLGRLIPLTVRLFERNLDAWSRLLRTGSHSTKLVMVSASADTPEGYLDWFARDGVFERSTSAPNPVGSAVDSFVVMVPQPVATLTVHALIRLHGGGFVASGRGIANPNDSEIMIDATLASATRVIVVVKDAGGVPLQGVQIGLGVMYDASTSANSVTHPVGSYRREMTNQFGEALFDDVPAGDRLRVELHISGRWTTISQEPLGNRELTEAKEHRFTYTVSANELHALSVSIRGGGGPTQIVLLERDGTSDWHRVTFQDYPGALDKASLRFSADNVLLLAVRGDCFFERMVAASELPLEVIFDADATVAVSGQVELSDKGTGLIYPYPVDPALCWASAMGDQCFPAARLDRLNRFKFRVPAESINSDWRVGLPDGRVYSFRYSASAEHPKTFEPMQVPVSSVELAHDAGGLKNATAVAYLVCPVFRDTARTLEAEMRLAVRVPATGTAVPAKLNLPAGRYIVFLTYCDAGGVARFGWDQGQHAEFLVRPDLTTKVLLPGK